MAANIIIVAVVGLVLFFAIRSIVKNRKSGGCAGCAGCQKKDCVQAKHPYA